MRPLEIVLSIANLSALCILIIPGLDRVRRAWPVAFLPVVVAALQLLIEGYRWQMALAYVLTLILSVALIQQLVCPQRSKPQRTFFERLTSGGLKGGGVLLFVVSLILPVFLRVFRLATPSGPYQIGTVTYHWTDSNRQEIFSTNPEDRRQLMAQVWYPVKGDPSSVRAPYVDDVEAVSAGLAQMLSANGVIKLPPFAFDQFQYVRTHAIPSAPIATDTASFPVLIYLTGLYGFRQASMFQVENLVSHGYVVVGLDQPYTAVAVTFPDGQVIEGLSRPQIQPLIDQSISPVENAPTLNGRSLPNGILPYLAQDVTFTLDQLAVLNASDPQGILNGHLDLQRTGVFGVSLGAMIAAEACHNNPRLDACLMMDAAMPANVMETGLPQPGMWLTRPADDMRLERSRTGGWTEKDIQQTQSTMQAVYDKAKPGSSYYVNISEMFHLNFTDAPYYFPFTSQLGLTGPINGRRGFNILNAYTLAFFNKSIGGQQSPLLDGPSKQYPEVDFREQ